MANLNSVLNFSAVMSKAGTGTITVTDTSVYPSGLPQTISGLMAVTQPDGITVTQPISWNGSQLNTAVIPIRLATNNSFQNGSYTFAYTVTATGYDPSALTKIAVLSYQAPILVIDKSFDLFTPTLNVNDLTTYGLSGFNYVGVNQAWTAAIVSVLGTTQNIVGATPTFNLAYLGNYYDSEYDVVLTSQPQWTLASASWVTVIDNLQIAQTYYAEIPPSLAVLLTELDALKLKLDSTVGNCATYDQALSDYTQAQAIFQHLKDRGNVGDLAGLNVYIDQLQKLFNNDVTPTYVNTDTIIPPYNWGSGTGTTTWGSITGKPATSVIEWVVGTGGFPGDGAATLVNATFTGAVRVFRDGQKLLGSNPGTGGSYYNKSGTTVTFFPSLTTGEFICVESIPL